jgi:peptidoglycan/LPS O-acetylase OafA/YrhL
MKTLHRIFGVLVILAFLLTGQFMDFQHPPVREMTDEGTRMMFRSRHIYILLAGLLNLGVGIYFTYWRERWRKILQVVGSSLMIVATLMLIGAFFYEPTLKGLQRTLTLPGIVAFVVGVFCHLFSGIRQGNKSVSPA